MQHMQAQPHAGRRPADDGHDDVPLALLTQSRPCTADGTALLDLLTQLRIECRVHDGASRLQLVLTASAASRLQLRTASADPRLDLLRRLLGRVTALVLLHDSLPSADAGFSAVRALADPAPLAGPALSLQPFSQALSLELHGMPPSSLARLPALRSQLQRIVVNRAVAAPSVRGTLWPDDGAGMGVGSAAGAGASRAWAALRALHATRAGLTQLDDSVVRVAFAPLPLPLPLTAAPGWQALLPALTCLDLRHNALLQVHCTADWPAIETLLASHNAISQLQGTHVLGHCLRVLDLSHNRLQELSGVATLFALEVRRRCASRRCASSHCASSLSSHAYRLTPRSPRASSHSGWTCHSTQSLACAQWRHSSSCPACAASR